MLDITPAGRSISFSLHVVAANCNKNPARCILHFYNAALSATEEPLYKFKAESPSSMWPTLLKYNLSACMAAGAHQFSCSEM